MRCVFVVKVGGGLFLVFCIDVIISCIKTLKHGKGSQMTIKDTHAGDAFLYFDLPAVAAILPLRIADVSFVVDSPHPLPHSRE